jgi:putative FmdB family regulatory protein
MPTYTYHCPLCRDETDLFHSIKECDSLQRCPVCHAPMTREVSAPAVLFLSSDLWTEPRYISQLEHTPAERIDMGRSPSARSPEAMCSSRSEMIEKVARRGFKVTSGAPVRSKKK